MKIIAVGDTHGRRKWEQVLAEVKEFDKFIFMGDYFDSRESISYDTQIANFKKILEFKEANPDKVVLLIGNHDFHYIKGVGDQYSGFDFRRFNDINAVLQPAIDSRLLQVCYRYGKYVFTHAGVTKTWVDDNDIHGYGLEGQLNNKFYTNRGAFRFTYGDPSGDDKSQGPTWVRIPSLLGDGLDGYTFVVGHTPMKNILILNNVIAIDTLGTSEEFLVIQDNKPFIEKLPSL